MQPEQQTVPATISKGKFDAAVVAARVIPLSELVTIPGIEQLPHELLGYLAHTPVNLQWMSRPVYWLKRGRSAAAVSDYVDPGWLDEQLGLEDEVRATLHRVVAAAAAGNTEALQELAGGVPTTISQSAKLQEVLENDEAALFDVPVEMSGTWSTIAAAGDPAERAALALNMWNADFRDLVPGFYAMLQSRLIDVRPALWRSDGPALLYFVDDGDGDTTIWVGWNPHIKAGELPPFWQTVPEPAQRFLTEVHPGFTMLDGESFGLAQPSYMSSFAQWSGWPHGIPEWNREGDFDSRRLLWLTSNSGDTVYCSSLDLPVGQLVTYTEDTCEVEYFDEALDALMLSAVPLSS